MQGLLAVWNDCLPNFKDRYHVWYETDHIPERIAIEGFLTATRYESIDRGSRDKQVGTEFFTSYELTYPKVLASPDYQTLLMAPSEKTQEMMSAFRNMWRSVAQLEDQAGGYAGAWLFTIRLGDGQTFMTKDHLQQSKTTLCKLLSDQHFFRDTGACRWRSFETVRSEGHLKMSQQSEQDFSRPSPEQRFRGSSDCIPDWFCLIEFRRESSLKKTVEEFLPPYVGHTRKLCTLSVDKFIEIGRTEKRYLLPQSPLPQLGT